MIRPCRPVGDLCGFFAGDWRLVRLAWDGGSRRIMRLRGMARFTPCAEGLLFEEAGTTRLAGQAGEAHRRYVFRFDDDGRADVRFSDGAPFHRLDLTTGLAEVRHECAPDLYEGRYRVLGADRWTLGWRVTGPRKRQLIASRFARCGHFG